MMFQMIAPSSPPRITFGFDDALLDHSAADRLRDGERAGERGGEIEHRRPDDGGERAQHARADDRRDGVRRIVEAVDEIEDERDQDDRDDVGDHVTSALRVLEGDALQHLRDAHAAVDRALERVVHLLPLDHLERIGRAREQRADRLVIDRVALLLELLDRARRAG